MDLKFAVLLNSDVSLGQWKLDHVWKKIITRPFATTLVPLVEEMVTRTLSMDNVVRLDFVVPQV